MGKSLLTGAVALLMTLPIQAQRLSPDVELNVPAEVFTRSGSPSPQCNQCCVYEDRNYSEGAVIKTEGVLLQCQRDEKTLSTHPLVWRRVRP